MSRALRFLFYLAGATGLALMAWHASLAVASTAARVYERWSQRRRG